MNDDRRALGSAHVEAPMNRLESQQGAAAISRRDMLRRSAVLGGALAVAAPAVQSFARPAFAATPDDLANLSSVYIVYRCNDGDTFGLKWEGGPWFGVSGTDGLFLGGGCDSGELGGLYPPSKQGDPDLISAGPSGPTFNGSNGPVWSVTFELGDFCDEDDFEAYGVAKYGSTCEKDALTITANGTSVQSLVEDEGLQTLGGEGDDLEGSLEDAATAAAALVVIPNLVGKPELIAVDDLKRLCEPEPCLQVVVEYRDASQGEDGLVIEQQPIARTEVERGSESEVRLFVGRAPEEEPSSSTETSTQTESTSSSDSGGQTQSQDAPDPEPETKADEGDE